MVCKRMIKKGIISYEGKKFCSDACKTRYKKSEEKGVCEFC